LDVFYSGVSNDLSQIGENDEESDDENLGSDDEYEDDGDDVENDDDLKDSSIVDDNLDNLVINVIKKCFRRIWGNNADNNIASKLDNSDDNVYSNASYQYLQ